MMKQEVVIVGGGFAGLAAGVELAARGHSVTLFEGRGHLGGRAYSFRDPATGSLLDNGQHIFMGCYDATLSFLERIGQRKGVEFQRNLSVQFAAPGGSMVPFRAWPLPSPWHLLGGVVSFAGFSWREKWRFRRAWQGLQNGENLEDCTVADWLRRIGQEGRVCERFWDLLALAALNDRPEVCSAASFEPVLKEALFSRKGSVLGLAKGGLSSLYGEPARAFIEERGGRLFLKTPVVKLHFAAGELRELELQGGRKIAPAVVVLAVPFGVLKKILPDWMVYQDPFFHPIHRLRSSPIVAVNLWYDRDFVPVDFVGFWGTRFHWLFNKGRILKGDCGPPYYSLVISGAREEMQMPGPQLVAMAEQELATIFPASQSARLLHSHVMKEPEATLSPTVGSGHLRLPQKTPYRNLFLAGDWTATGLPATIEGAVRSAYRVVDLIEGNH